MNTCPVCTVPLSLRRSFFDAGWRGFFRCPICRGHLQLHGRVAPLITALLAIIAFIVLDLSGTIVVTFATLWWDAFQIGCVLFVLFLMLGWLLHIDRRQPGRKFVP
ncbi:MAG TPA: hypothetical protein VFN53_11295 [Acidobacteriaceae bacterium]|nr:hypothetical protein [Acidobacteriaceae bacterium]